MDMQMWNFQPGDQKSRAGRVEGLAHGLPHRAGNRGDFGEESRIDVLPLIDLGARNHQYVALRDRSDREKGYDVIVFPYETSWYISVDDGAED